MWQIDVFKNQKVDSFDDLVLMKTGKKEFSFNWGEIKKKLRKMNGILKDVELKIICSNNEELLEAISYASRNNIKFKTTKFVTSPLKVFSTPTRFSNLNLLNAVKDVFIPFDKIDFEKIPFSAIEKLEKISIYSKKVNKQYINGFLYFSPIFLQFKKKTNGQP